MFVVFVLIMGDTVLIRVYIDTDECPNLLKQVTDQLEACGFLADFKNSKYSAYAFKMEFKAQHSKYGHYMLHALKELQPFFDFLALDCEYDNTLINIDSIKEL